MFRKSRKSSPNTANSTSLNEPRFLKQFDPISGVESSQQAPFSVGIEATDPVKPKSLGFFSRLFKRSSELVKNFSSTNPDDAGTTSKKSIWQRSKSILRPRGTVDPCRSDSSILLADIPIRGSGSAAQLLYEDRAYDHYYFKGESTDDLESCMMLLFTENELHYTELRRQRRQECTEEQPVPCTSSVNLITAAIEDPSSRVYDELLSCAQISRHCEQVNFSDDPKLDSPLSECGEEYDEEEYEEMQNVAEDNRDQLNISVDNSIDRLVVSLDSQADSVDSQAVDLVDPESQTAYSQTSDSQTAYSDSQSQNADSDSVSQCSESDSMVTSLNSYNSGNFNIDGIEQNSLDEMAALFGLLDLTSQPPQILPDGSVRYVCSRSASGSAESIRFHDWTIDAKLRPCQSETLKLTEISVNNNTLRNKTEEKQPNRSASVSDFRPKPTEAASQRRRTVSEKISEIVAFFEGGGK